MHGSPRFQLLRFPSGSINLPLIAFRASTAYQTNQIRPKFDNVKCITKYSVPNVRVMLTRQKWNGHEYKEIKSSACKDHSIKWILPSHGAVICAAVGCKQAKYIVNIMEQRKSTWGRNMAQLFARLVVCPGFILVSSFRQQKPLPVKEQRSKRLLGQLQDALKGQPGARSSRFCRVRPLWVLCT
jgi:hypothetical protein